MDKPVKNILIAVSGGVAAYKAVELVRLAKKAGHDVQVLMTKAAAKFVTSLTFQAVSGKPVLDSLWRPQAPDGMDHIKLADTADLVIVAPATADFIGKLAHGLGGDLITTTLLAYRGQLLVAPAMNDQMFENPAVKQNLQTLCERNIKIIGPASGELACGHTGTGRMSEPQEIWHRAEQLLNPRQDYQGVRVLVTAGPTREALDSVRFLTNHSSGKMGFALAKEAQRRGADVTLISGPTQLTPPKGVRFVAIESARQMHEQVLHHENCDLVIMAAAVSDFTFEDKFAGKIKKSKFGKTLTLTPNPDILQDLGERRNTEKRQKPLLVGFSMETENLIEHSKRKLAEKHCDFIVANRLDVIGEGFGADTNRVHVLSSDGGTIELPLLSKEELAGNLLDRFRPSIPARLRKVMHLA